MPLGSTWTYCSSARLGRSAPLHRRAYLHQSSCRANCGCIVAARRCRRCSSARRCHGRPSLPPLLLGAPMSSTLHAPLLPTSLLTSIEHLAGRDLPTARSMPWSRPPLPTPSHVQGPQLMLVLQPQLLLPPPHRRSPTVHRSPRVASPHLTPPRPPWLLPPSPPHARACQAHSEQSYQCRSLHFSSSTIAGHRTRSAPKPRAAPRHPRQLRRQRSPFLVRGLLLWRGEGEISN